ncbi:Hypothetical protein D9617_7g030620 [Elsinoe fawcettii]|nr:Hypothetical protein D9617_7g030620 [Elsinoe fawcettii]
MSPLLFRISFISWFLIVVVSAITPAPARLAAPTPFCSKQFGKALSKVPARASRFCKTFTKQKTQTVYPNFIWTYCDVDTYKPKKVNAALSQICTSFMRKTSSKLPSKTLHVTTRPGATTSAKSGTGNTVKTAPKSISKPSLGVETLSRSMASTPSSLSSRSISTAIQSMNTLTRTTSASSSSTSVQMLEAAPTATLIPVLDVTNDPKDLNNLRVQNSSALFYAEQSLDSNPYAKQMMAKMRVNFKYPTVLVENTDYLTDVSCNTTGWDLAELQNTRPLDLAITTREAYLLIENDWAPYIRISYNAGDPPPKDMVLIFRGDDCEQTANHTRVYWLGHVEGLRWDDQRQSGVLRFLGDEILVQEGIEDARLMWGANTALNATTPRDNNTYSYPSNQTCAPVAVGNNDWILPLQGNPCVPSIDAALDEKLGYKYALAAQKQPSSAPPQPDFWESIWNAISSAVETIVNIAITVVQVVATIVLGFDGEFVCGKFTLDLAPPNLDESPWGPAFLLYKSPGYSPKPAPTRSGAQSALATKASSSNGDEGGFYGSIAAYCVDCGAHGTIEYWGSADISIAGGLRKLQVGMQGSMKAGLNLGIHVKGGYETKNSQSIIVGGPQMSLEASFQAKVSASGEILAGISMDAPYFHVLYDLVDHQNSKSIGLDDLNIKNLGIGVEIPLLNENFAARLIDTPALTAEASYEVDVASGGNVPKPEVDDDDPPCKGIEWGVNFTNTLAFNFLDIVELELHAWKPPPFVKGCFNFTSDTATIGNASDDSYTNAISTPTFNFTSNATSGISLVDTSNTLFLVAAVDDNLYVQKSPEGATFFQNASTVDPLWIYSDTRLNAKDEPALFTDDRSRAMFLFPELLLGFGVTRTRVLGLDRVPDGAVLTALVPGNLDDNEKTPDAYFFPAPARINMSPRVLLLTVCEVEDAMGRKTSKVFAVMDPVKGPKTLMESKFMPSTVTGGTARNCSILALKLAKQQ